MKYLKPEKLEQDDSKGRLRADNELHQRLIRSFLRNNVDIYDRIKKALEEKDIKLAHRLAHTLKSNAAQLDKTSLQRAALNLEKELKTSPGSVTAEQMETLKDELDIVFTAFEQFVDTTAPASDPPEFINTGAAIKLMDELEPMLEENNFESMKYIEALRSVQGGEALIGHIENLDFRLAQESLARLRERITGDP